MLKCDTECRGVWSCDFGGERDGYGRGLFGAKISPQINSLKGLRMR